MSSVQPSLIAKKNQQALRWLLQKKAVEFNEYDISIDEKAREDMFAVSAQRSAPQLFIDGKFIGNFERVQELEEDEEFDGFLV